MADLLSDLRKLRDAGDAGGYYRRLSQAGDRYGDLAGGVVNANTLSGMIANGFLRGSAGHYVSNATISQIISGLMTADFAARSKAVTDGRSPLNLDYNAIRNYHANVLEKNGLNAGNWTAETPLNLAGRYFDQLGFSSADAAKQHLWDQMLQNGNDILNPVLEAMLELGIQNGDLDALQWGLDLLRSLDDALRSPIDSLIREQLGNLAADVFDLLADASDLFGMLFPNPFSLPIDPLVVDLNGDGVQLISVTQSKVNFDFDGDGFRERTGWVSAQDGLLVRDLNGNGRIESLQELIGTATQDAYSVLRGMDGNADGQITAADAVWSTLKVWQDANSNGVTDAGELKTLAELGITEFNLGGTSVGQRVNGNFIHSRSTIVMNGQTNESQAVFFDTARNIAIFTPPAGFVPHPDAAKLPNLSGGGGTPSLAYSMSTSPMRRAA